MLKRQRGFSLLGFILICVMAGMLGFAGLKLTPAYLEYLRVRQVLKDIKTQFDGQEASVVAIRNALEKRLDVEAVETLQAKDFAVQKSANGLVVRSEYDRVVPYLFNVSLLVSFDEAVELSH
jgi:hypothetical protein